MDGRADASDNVSVERLLRTAEMGPTVYRKITVHRSTPTPTSTASFHLHNEDRRIAPLPRDVNADGSHRGEVSLALSA